MIEEVGVVGAWLQIKVNKQFEEGYADKEHETVFSGDGRGRELEQSWGGGERERIGISGEGDRFHWGRGHVNGIGGLISVEGGDRYQRN